MKINRKLIILAICVIAVVLLLAISSTFAFGSIHKPVVSKDKNCKISEPVCLDIRELQHSESKLKPKQHDEFTQATTSFTGSTGRRNYTYSIAVNGNVKTNMSTFANLVAQTLNDPRGWSQIANFSRGNSNALIIVLAEASLVPSYSGFCSSQWSCRVGPYVIINEDRWLNASPAWNASGGSLRDYQHMVVNHELGHWLGHGHRNCAGAGKLAPLMQQQSINLQGCKFNPWPTSSELAST